jgi:ABC-type dipeptide/oligopeptide/nickel transport system ATPase component
MSEIDEAINYEMNDIDEKDQSSDELHSVIDPSIKFTLNSINVLVGQTGSGKSRAVFREISKLKWVDNNPYHQFIYVTDENNDKTYEKYKDMIPVPILKIGYKEACEKLIELNRMKNGYEKIKASSMNGIELLSEEEKGTVKDYLQIKDFDIPILHTLILFDDATDVFNSPKNELNNIFLRNRHNKFTYFSTCTGSPERTFQ